MRAQRTPHREISFWLLLSVLQCGWKYGGLFKACLIISLLVSGRSKQQYVSTYCLWEEVLREHSSSWVQGERFEGASNKYKVWTGADNIWEWGGTFESEEKVLRENVNMKSLKYALKLKNYALDWREKSHLIVIHPPPETEAHTCSHTQTQLSWDKRGQSLLIDHQCWNVTWWKKNQTALAGVVIRVFSFCLPANFALLTSLYMS